jgi:hypothetical protein
MGTFFNRERFGNAQIAAGFLLLILIAECGWVIAHQTTGAASLDEYARIEAGTAQWHGRGVAGTPAGGAPAFDRSHSPLWYLLASAPVAFFRIPPDSRLWIWLTRAPYTFFAVMLGGSLWYVSRRLYGNAGGFIALGLYCFSPIIIRTSSLWYEPPQVAAAWGLFGAVFTAIAVSHTLYAPREVVLWNWRRIVLLAVSLALAIGSQYELAIVVPLLLAFMLYLAPERKTAAVGILASACTIAAALVFCSYFLHPTLFWRGMVNAKLLDVSWRAVAMPVAYLQVSQEIKASGPVMAVLVPAAIIGYLFSRRSRYFGNTAPLIVALLFAGLRVGSPHAADSIYSLAAVVFLFVFVAGIAADLIEIKAGRMVSAVLVGLLTANALSNFIWLWNIGH